MCARLLRGLRENHISGAGLRGHRIRACCGFNFGYPVGGWALRMIIFRKPMRLPPRPVAPTEAEAARLERAQQETRWRRYDEPAELRLMARTKCAEIFGIEIASRGLRRKA